MSYYNNVHKLQQVSTTRSSLRIPNFPPPPIPSSYPIARSLPPIPTKLSSLSIYDDAREKEKSKTAQQQRSSSSSLAKRSLPPTPPPPLVIAAADKKEHVYTEIMEPVKRKYDLLFAQPQLRIVQFNASVWLIWISAIAINISTFTALFWLRQFADTWLTVAKNAALLSAINFTLLGFTVNHVYANKETWLSHFHRSLAFISFAFALLHVIAHMVLLADAFADDYDDYDDNDDDDNIVANEIIAKNKINKDNNNKKDNDSKSNGGDDTGRRNYDRDDDDDDNDDRGLHYLTNRAVFYVTGVGMLASLIVLLSCASRGVRKRRYNVFYYAHVVGAGSFVAIGIVHSFWYVLAILYPVTFVYAPRLLRRWFVRVHINAVEFGQDYVMLTLMIYHGWLNETLLLNGLMREMRDVWLVCPTFGTLERHPFTVLEANKYGNSVRTKLLIWRHGDWKAKVTRRLADNQKLMLHNYGLRVLLDESRTSDLMSNEALKSNNVLFILENAGISSFMSYANYLWLTAKMQDRPRNIVLHYRVDDTSIFDELSMVLSRIRSLPSISATAFIYTIRPATFEGKATTCQTCRLDYKRILKSFFLVTLIDSGGGGNDDDAAAAIARRMALENGSVFVYSNDEALRERVVRQMRRWIKKGYYEGCDDDSTRFTKQRKINLIL